MGKWPYPNQDVFIQVMIVDLFYTHFTLLEEGNNSPGILKPGTQPGKAIGKCPATSYKQVDAPELLNSYWEYKEFGTKYPKKRLFESNAAGPPVVAEHKS